MANQFVAYQDERHGLAAWVAKQIAADLFGNKVEKEDSSLHEVPDGADPRANASAGGAPSFTAEGYGMSLSAGGRDTALMSSTAPRQRPSEGLDHAYRTWTSPRSNAADIMSTIIGSKAQVGVLPLYDNDMSFNRDTLDALIDFPANKVIREYVAESNYVLAAPADLIHEIEQSGFTNSFSKTGPDRTFEWNQDKQERYLNKVTTILATPDAMNHCGPALDGFRARGIDVQMLPDGADAYREGLRQATEMLDPTRSIETMHSETFGQSRVSKSSGSNHNKPVVAVMLSADKAMPAAGYNYDSDYVVLASEMAGADRIRTSFVALKKGIPPFPPEGVEWLNYEMGELKRRFAKPKSAGGTDQRALYPIEGDQQRSGTSTKEGGPALIRCLYKVNTIGPGAKDVSPVFRALAEQKFSYSSLTLDGRDGNPIVFAVDVPAERWRDMRPVLRELTKMTAFRRLADFPALQPMVKADIMPSPRILGSRAGKAGYIIALIGAAVAGYFAFQIF